MRYNIAQLLKEPVGSTRNYQLDESFAGPQRFADMACGPVSVLRTHHGILVRAEVQVRTTLTCGRCLGGLVRSSELSIEEEFYPAVDLQTGRSLLPPPEAGEGSLIDADHILDLTGTVREYVETDSPMKPLCHAECLGLCQRCGTNLNVAQCNCAGPGRDPRWRVLAELVHQPKG